MTYDERKHEKSTSLREGLGEAKDVKEILSAVSSEVPTLIKSILDSVFSEAAGRSMGKAAAAYYKELKDGGLPEQVAVKLTEEYTRTFTSLGDMLRSAGKGARMQWSRSDEDLGDEIERKIAEKIEKRRQERKEEEEE
jgi:hypothetical protein